MLILFMCSTVGLVSIGFLFFLDGGPFPCTGKVFLHMSTAPMVSATRLEDAS